MNRDTLYFLIFVIITTLTIAEKVSYKNYRIYTVSTKTDQDKATILKFVVSFDGYLPWNIVHPMSIVVPPTHIQDFEQAMKAANLEYRVTMNDVQAVIDNQNLKLGTIKTFDWTRYHTLDEINNWLDNLPKQYTGIVETVIGGSSYEGRQIKGVKISFKNGNPGVVLESGIHPNEWISPATTTYLINEFLNSKDENVRKLAESYDWYVFPILNADGYIYTQTTDRLWRKTVAPFRAENRSCIGVDLNRNWGYGWQKSTIPNGECHSFYQGSASFTEIEAITFSEYIKSISNKLFAYLTFHNLGQLILIPYGYNKNHLDNYSDAYAIATQAAKALTQKNGKKFGFGSMGEVFSIQPGSSMDWMKGELKMQLAYSFLMRDVGEYGYLLPPEQIIPNSQEILNSLIALFQEAEKRGYPKKKL